MKLANGTRVRALENLIGVPFGAQGIVVDADPFGFAHEVRFYLDLEYLDEEFGPGDTLPMETGELEVIEPA